MIWLVPIQSLRRHQRYYQIERVVSMVDDGAPFKPTDLKAMISCVDIGLTSMKSQQLLYRLEQAMNEIATVVP